MLTLVGYVLKNLGRQKLRTALSIFGVMLGVWLVVIFSAISAGALRTQQAMLTQFGEDFHCYKAAVADQFLSTLPESETREALRSVSGVADTASVLIWFTRHPSIWFVPLFGLRPDEFAVERLMMSGTGEFSGPDAHEAIVGTTFLKSAKLDVGDELTMQGVTLRIVGSYVTGQPLYDSAVVVPITKMKLFRDGENLATFIAVRVEPGASPKEVADRIEERYPELSTVRTLEELSKVDQGIEKMKMWSFLISAGATGIGWLFVMLAMIMSVYERTRELGILRAVGLKQRQIVKVIFLESLVLTVLGALIGIPSGLAIVELMAWATDLSNYIEPAYELALYSRAFLVAFLAATIGGIYPAWRAARLRPVEALRHE
ncbi:MAG: ABC transporter permease [Planctomycetota bacterium]|jgi:putative ABC transport system permease protein